jgi:SAM-dependent methyltransferase
MGIGPIPADILRRLPKPEGFTVIELGDQIWHQGNRRSPEFWQKPARVFYEKLGCSRYESIDGNGGGTILADLNHPLDPHPGQFDLVTDVGTSEHCFDFAQVWRTIHSLCKPGGVIFFEKPHDGFPEHGFYNLQKTLFVDLAGANEYEILELKRHRAPRGMLLRGAYRKGEDKPFNYPLQGKYHRTLKIGSLA